MSIKDILGKNKDGLTVKEISKSLNISKSEATGKLSGLKKSGKLRVRKVGRANLYYLSKKKKKTESKKPKAKKSKKEEVSYLKTVLWLLGITLFVVLSLIAVRYPPFVGLFSTEELITYSQPIGLEISEGQTQSIILEDFTEAFNLVSFKLSGELIGQGDVKVFIEDVDSGKKFLVLDSDKIIQEGTIVTGLQVEGTELAGDSGGDSGGSDSGDSGSSSDSSSSSDSGSDSESESGDSSSDSSDSEDSSSDTPSSDPEDSSSDAGSEESDSSDASGGETSTESSDDSTETSGLEEVVEEETSEETSTEESIEDSDEVGEEDTEAIEEGNETSEDTSEESLDINETIEETQDNETEETSVDEAEEETNVTKEEESGGSGLRKIDFSGVCIETCLISDEIDSTNYNLVFEIDSGNLVIDEIEYVLKDLTKKVEIDRNITEENVTVQNVSLEDSTTGTKNYQIVVGRPVKWIKEIENNENVGFVEIPKEAEGIISVKKGLEADEVLDEIEEYENSLEDREIKRKLKEKSKIDEDSEVDEGDIQELEREIKEIIGDKISETVITGNVISLDSSGGKGIRNLWSIITGNVVSDLEFTETNEEIIVDVSEVVQSAQENETIVLEYYTEAPQVFEKDTNKGKEVVVSGPDELGYTDILAFTDIQEIYGVGEESKIRVYWQEGSSYVNFDAYDLDSNGLLDYVEWIVPHLSNQTYEIILITSAEHLDSNREFISDIYGYVSEEDGNWSEPIYAGEYVRITFGKNLTSENDITITARSSLCLGLSEEDDCLLSSVVEVYHFNSTEKITEFSTVGEEATHKVFLTGMTGSHDTFDLKINGNPGEYVEFDFIVDPSPTYNGSTEASSGSTEVTSLEINVPSGVQEDDLIIAVVGISESEDSGAHLDTPSGWTLVTSQEAQSTVSIPNVTVYRRVASDSEPSSYTWTNGGTTTGIHGHMLIYSNVGNLTEDPIGQIAVSQGASTGCPTAPSVTTVNDNETVLYIGFTDDDEVPATEANFYPASTTGREATEGTAGGNGMGMGTAEEVRDTAGATGTRAFQNCQASEEWGAITISILPILNNPPTTPTNITCDGSNDCNQTFMDSVDLQCTGSIDPDGDLITYEVWAFYNTTTLGDGVLVNENFDSDEGGFVYQDGIYGTSNPTKENGVRVSSSTMDAYSCPSGSCLEVSLNIENTGSSEGPYSGGWNKSFTVTNAGDFNISFDYRLIVSSEIEAEENTNIVYRNVETGAEVIAATIVGNGNGGSNDTVTGSVDYIASLTPGQYSFDVGCNMTEISLDDEKAECLIDNVVIQGPEDSSGYSWHKLGNHSEGGNYTWNFTGIDAQSGIDLRCRAIDLGGSNTYSSNFTKGSSLTITDADITVPLINFVDPTETDGDLFARNNTLINVTATDSNLDNITILLYNSTSDLVSETTTASSPNFVNISGLVDGLYFFNASAADTSNNVNYTSTRNVTIDTAPLEVFELVPVAGSTFNVSQVIEISANATNGLSGVDTVIANITLADGSNSELMLSNVVGDKYNNSYAISDLEGQYNITFVANDTLNNLNETETTYFIVSKFVDSIEINSTNSAGELHNLTLIVTNSTGDIVLNQFNDTFTFPLPVGVYNITQIPENQTAGFFNLTLVDVNVNESFSLADLDYPGIIYASGITGFAVDPVIGVNFGYVEAYKNATNEVLYKCADWNFTAQECGIGCSDDDEEAGLCEVNSSWGTPLLTGLTVGEAYRFTFNATDPGFSEYTESAGESSTTSTTFENKTTLTFTPDNAGPHLLIATAQLHGNAQNRNVNVRVLVDGATASDVTWEPKDSAVANDYQAYGMHIIQDLDVSTHIIELQWSTENADTAALIKNARISVVELRSGDVVNSTLETGQALTTSYAEAADITINPNVEDDYLIIGTGELQTGSTSESGSVRLLINGTDYDNSSYESKDTTDYKPFFFHRIVNLTSGTDHNISIEARRTGSAGGEVRRTRISALRLTPDYDVHFAENNTIGSVTCSTNDCLSPFVDQTVLTFTPVETADYLFIATAEFNSGRGNDQGLVNLDIDGTDECEVIQERRNNPNLDRNLFVCQKNVTLTAGVPTTAKIEFASQEAGGSADDATTTIYNARITAIRITPDTTSPNITDLIPTESSEFNISDVIEVAANVTDLFGIDTVLANVTSPDGTVNQLNLSDVEGDKFNSSFTIPSIIGLYNVTIIANDSSGNINSTETTNFTVVDLIPPSVFDLIPDESSGFNVSQTIEIAANATNGVEVDTLIANITSPDGTIDQVILRNVSALTGTAVDKFNNSFVVPNFIGLYNVTIIANDTSNNINDTETTNFTAFDFISPTINFTDPTEVNFSILNRNNIVANVTSTDGFLDTIVVYLYNSTDLVTNTSSTSPFLTNFSGLVDGTYFLNATSNDTSNNVNQTETRHITLDTTVPLVNFTDPTPANGTVTTGNEIIANVTASDTNLDTIVVYLYNSTDLVTNTSSTSPFLTNFSGLVGGDYFLNVTANDSAGNVNVTEVREITLDNSAPSVDFVIPTETSEDFINRNNTLINVTAVNGNLANITIQLFNSTSDLISETTTTSSPNFVNITDLNDGIYFFNATAVDLALNENFTSTRNVTIDTEVPLVDFVDPTDVSGSLLNRNNTIINLTASDTNFVNLTVRLYNLTDLISETTTTSSPNFVNITDLNDGIYFFNASAVDLALNENFTTTRNVTIDTMAPTIDFISPTPVNGTFQPDIPVNVTVQDAAVDVISIFLFNSTNDLINSVAGSSNPLSTNFSGLDDGTYFVNATVNDTSGNMNQTEKRTIFIDMTEPVVNFTDPTPANGTIITGSEIVVNMTASDTNLDTLVVFLYNSTDLIINSSSTSPFLTNFSSLVDGTYFLNATANDSAGNLNFTEVREITLDNSAPSIDFVDPTETDGDFVNRNNTLVNVTAVNGNLANITIRLYNSTSDLISEDTTTSSPNFVNISGLADGLYFFNASAVDLALNENFTVTRNFTVDTEIPLVDFVDPTELSGSLLNRNNTLINVTASNGGVGLANITIQLFNSTGDLISETTTLTSPSFVNITDLADGTYYFNATAVDLADNVNFTLTRNVIIDTEVPSFQDLGEFPVDPATYSQGQFYEFNVSVIDSSIDEVILEFNGVNSTITDIVGSVFRFNISDLPVGVHNYVWYANDTFGNSNSTSQTYTVNQAASEVNLTLDGTDGNITVEIDSVVNLTGEVIFGEGNMRLLREGVLINEGSQLISNLSAFNSLGTFNITVIYDGTQNFTESSETHFVTVDDITSPKVTNVTATPSIINQVQSTEINATVTDNGIVNTVIAQITLSNGSVENQTMTNISSSEFNSTFTTTITYPVGQYSVIIFANDSKGNLNSTEGTSFNVNDVTVPNVFDLVPINGSTYNTSDVIEISANITDNIAVDIVLANITLPNGTISQIVLGNVSAITGSVDDQFNNSFTIPDDLGTYVVKFIANDSSSNINDTEIVFFVSSDSINPEVFDLTPLAGTQFNVSEVIEIKSNVTDNIGISEVFVNITYPNGTVNRETLTLFSGTDIYNTSFTIPGLLGLYNLTFIANDTSDNVNVTEETNFEVIDISDPVINLSSPINSTSFGATVLDVSFKYEVDDLNITNCTLFVNSSVVNDSVSAGYVVNVTDGSVNEFVNQLAIGTYSWNISCIDVNSNEGFSETRTFTVTEPAPAPTPTPSSGGGGGGSGVTRFIEITPSEIDASILADETRIINLEIENLVRRGLDLDIFVEGDISEVISIESSVQLGASEKKEFEFSLGPAESPSFGKIVFKYNRLTVGEVMLVMDISSEDLLFDVVSTIPEDKRKISIGENLSLDVEFFQIAAGNGSDEEPFVKYLIKDLNGNVLFEDSEHLPLLAIDSIKYSKEFPTYGLFPGEYVLVIEVLYSEGKFATSSSSFAIARDVVPDWVYVVGAVSIILLWILIRLAGRSVYRGALRRKRNRLGLFED